MELLAPAGNMECLKAAVRSGADAVYFAGKSFGARSFADNFSPEEIREGAAYCRLRGVRAYVTVNTMTLDREFKELDSFTAVLAEAGVDGVIVQDLGVLARIRELCPELSLHASTQMTVHSLDGVRALEKLGVRRVVLSRELSAVDMRYILDRCTVEIEVFVHGAMCMSYSGQCLMSSVLGGRSGNRGKCAQPCRLAYHREGGPEKYYLSLRDMSLIGHLRELKEMGAASLKIEGRMKGPAYVSAVVSAYRRCLDEGRRPRREELEQLDRVFYRGGLTDGYFTGRTGPGMFAFDKPDNPYARGGEQARPEPARERTARAACRAVLTEGAAPEITLRGMGETVTCRGTAPLEPAQKNPAGPEDVKKQLCRTGGTAFVLEPVEIEIKGRPFVPVKVLNSLRREAVETLSGAVLAQGKKRIRQVPPPEKTNGSQRGTMRFTAMVRTAEQFLAIREFPLEWIGVPLHAAEENPALFLPERERIMLCPPVILPDRQSAAAAERLARLRQMGFTRLLAENLGWFELGCAFALWGGHRLNTANSRALRTLSGLGAEAVCLSAELNLAQIRDMDKPLPAEVLVYGHLPLMITENCVLKNMGGCPCGGVGAILDRKGTRFPVVMDGEACRSVILNSVPLYMGDKKPDLDSTGAAFGRLLFTVETPEACADICRRYLAGGGFDRAYTRLHFYKGVL